MTVDEMNLIVDEEQGDQSSYPEDHIRGTPRGDAIDGEEAFLSDSHTPIPVGSLQVTHNAVENQTIPVFGAGKTNVSKKSASTTNNAAPKLEIPKPCLLHTYPLSQL